MLIKYNTFYLCTSGHDIFAIHKEKRMFNKTKFALILSAAFLLASAAAFAQSAPESIGEQIFAITEKWDDQANMPLQTKVEGLETQELTKVIKHKNGSTFTVKLSYPQGTGNLQVDQAIKEPVEKYFAEAQTQADDLFSDDEPNRQYISTYTYLAYRPSNNYLSIVGYDYSAMGAAHDNFFYSVNNYNLKTGKALTIADVFPEAATSLPDYIKFVNAALDKKYEREGGHSFDMEAAEKSVKNMVFTPEGVSLIFGPYEQGSYAEGPKTIDISKNELKNLGASMIFWE